ncbi:MAG: cytochrome bd ubiquinol oxidase subunit, partial [Actinomycetota bacterium]|nr:cytochrome bd ubiquinol oxidase subunit [Actinomycetota bacterium]
MSVADLAIIVIWIGLTAYVVLAGADFGGGWWDMLAGKGERGRAIRDLIDRSMAPVWEANHVWLIFVLTVTWTAYPAAFGSIASTLAVPLLLAGLGIIVRGAAYALRTAASRELHLRAIDVASAVASVVTPFALGAAVGGIASGRVPLGNAAGEAIGSWLNPTSVVVGVLAVATSAYLAAVWLTADAARAGRDDLVEAFRVRALATGAIAGALALAGLLVLRSDAERIYHGVTSGSGLVAVLASAAAGAATMLLIARRRLEPARWSAAVAV